MIFNYVIDFTNFHILSIKLKFRFSRDGRHLHLKQLLRVHAEIMRELRYLKKIFHDLIQIYSK